MTFCFCSRMELLQ